MSTEIENKNFITTVLANIGPSVITPDFSKYTYGLWVSIFQNPNHSENGYSIPTPLVEDIASFKSAVTGKKFSTFNFDGKAAKARFFLTEGLLGLDGYDYLKEFEITDRFVSGYSPNIIMPDMDYSGNLYRRYEITGITKSNATNNNILTVSGEDWVKTNISVNYANTDEIYTYSDVGSTGYKNEVTARYKFLYDDSANSIVEDYSVFEIPFQLENQTSLKYRVSRASEPLGIYDYAELTADGKAVIDYSKYKDEVSGVVDGQIVYSFEALADLSFTKSGFKTIYDNDTIDQRAIDDPTLTGFKISKNDDLFKFALQSTGDFNDIYKVDVLLERFYTKDKPNISGYVMTSYNTGDGAVSIPLTAQVTNVFPRVNEDGLPFGYDNLQDLIDREQIKESEKYTQEINIPDAGGEDTEKLAKVINDNNAATMRALNGQWDEDPKEKEEEEPSAAWKARSEIDDEDSALLTQENNEILHYKTALPNFFLPKKTVTKDFYSNYINSGEEYILTPLSDYGLVKTFSSCGDEFGVLGYFIRQDKDKPEGSERYFRSVVNTTCDGLYVDATGFCKGDSAIYSNQASSADGVKIQNGFITEIPDNGIISKDNYTNQESWLKAINYFYTKNYVASFNVYSNFSESDYTTLFSQALMQVNSGIGGISNNNAGNSFYSNGASGARIFVEREIYTKSYRENESSKINQAILSGVYTPAEADLASEEIEKLYCVHTYEPNDADSFAKDKQSYFYPAQDYSEQISFRKFLENSSAGLSYSTGEVAGVVSFIDGDAAPNKLFRVEYVTGDSFSYADTPGFRAWNAASSPPPNISITNQNTKNYSYHLYGYNSTSADLSFLRSNVQSGQAVAAGVSAGYSNLVVLKFIKQDLTDAIFNYEVNENNAKKTLSAINSSIVDSNANLIPESKVRVNIQTYDYKLSVNSESHQWTIFNQNPINNNIYGNRKSSNLSEPRFFEDDAEETQDVLSTLFLFPNGPFTSKNYEGKPISRSSINALSDGLFENNIYIKEENQRTAAVYESNYVLEVADNGSITKQNTPASAIAGKALFANTRRLPITKIKYNFYTKDLILIGDASTPYSTSFNAGWEYDLQFKKKASITDWAIMSKEGAFSKDVISSQYSVISPYYFTPEDLENPNSLAMVAFKTNLPLFLDDKNYEFRILKREKLIVYSDSANVIKKTNFLPIKIDWNEVAGCSYYNIYQKDRDNNLLFLKSEPSGVNSFSYAIPDVKQKNVDLGVYNFPTNGINYYDIVVSGVKSSVTKTQETLTNEYGFEIGNSDFSENKITKFSQAASYTPVNVSSPTYSQLLNFNNPESKTSNFEINQNYNNYYFVTDKKDSTLVNIPSSFESYVLNTGNANCSVGSSSIPSNHYAKISSNGTVTSAAAASLPSSSFDLLDAEDGDCVYLSSSVNISNNTPIANKTLTIVNDSNSSINVVFGNTEAVAANKTKKLSFTSGVSPAAITLVKTYSNVTAQDSEIYYPKDGFINLNHSTGTFSPADNFSNLPIYNFSKEDLVMNGLTLKADSFNYVGWNGTTASNDPKDYFDDLKVYLRGNENNQDTIKLLKDDYEIILSEFSTILGATKEYFFLKDESIKRSLNIKITNGGSKAFISKQNQDFKLTVNRTNESLITYSIIYPSGSPLFQISNSREQLVLLKGDSIQYIDLASLDSGLKKESFIYFVNKNSSSVYFYRYKQENVIYTLAQNQVARGTIQTSGSTNNVRLEILNDTLSHFYFNVDSTLIPSTINILDLNFCCTSISLPAAADLASKDLFLICRNRFIPNKIDKQKIKDKGSVISTEDDPSTSEINEIGDLASNSISLRVFRDENTDSLPTVERTSFLEKNFRNYSLDTQDFTTIEDSFKCFYIRNENIDTFTIKDFYNRKTEFKGKIFLPTSSQSLVVQSFDSVDSNNLFRIRERDSIDFDYSPDDYVNGRLKVEKTDEPDAKIYSKESEAGSTVRSFPNALDTNQILINFSYNTATVSVDSSTVTLVKNRLVKNSLGNFIFPVYNKKEFFIALTNSFRTNTEVNGGTRFYYIIKANEVDIESIILPDSPNTTTFVIKNDSGRPYQVKMLNGQIVYSLLPNDQKLFTYTGAPYTVTTDAVDFDDLSVINPPTSIRSANQYLDLETEHPLASFWSFNSSEFVINSIDKALIGETGEEASILVTNNSTPTDYAIFDVYSSVPSSSSPTIYCYGRKPIKLNTLAGKKYIVNDFYLFVQYQGWIINREQFYMAPGTSEILNENVYDLNIIDKNYNDLTKFFTTENEIAALPNVIFIPIVNYASKFYLPNLKSQIKNNDGDLVKIATLMVGKKIVFVNLTKSDSSDPNSIYNYYLSATTNLLDINSLALYSVNGEDWAQGVSNLPVVKKVFPTAKNLKGISNTSTTEITGGKEFLYLPNFNRFNVDLDSFEDKSFRDFYVFNPCKYRLYIGSNNSLLSTGALTKVTRAMDTKKSLFTGTSLDLNGSSVFSVSTLSYEANRAPEILANEVNKAFPKLKPGSKIKIIYIVGTTIETRLFNYSSNGIATETEIKDRDYGVLDLQDLLQYSPSNKLFVYGSSQVNESGGYFDDYNVKLLNATKLGVEKFYVYNNTPYFLKIYFDFETQKSLDVPPKTFAEITNSALNFLGVYEKGKYYISKNSPNINYIIKTNLKIYINGLRDYINFAADLEKDNQEENILITSVVKDEDTVSYSYWTATQNFYDEVFDNFKFISMANLAGMDLSKTPDVKNTIKPVYSISSAGHYLLNDNSNDITVTPPATYGPQIFLINNCPRDIFVTVLGQANRRRKVYRNSVLVIERGQTGDVEFKYLKKAKSRDEFYCVFNPNTSISTQREIALGLGIIRNEDLIPIVDDNEIEQKSYIKLLSKDGSSSKINLALRNYYNGKDIPTDSASDVVGYEVGIGHETIHRFLFFDPSISTYTLPGIQKGVKYQVGINKGFFDNINITTDTAFTNVEEAPFVKYDGKIFDNDGDTFTGGDVSVYEIKYPNFVTVYKVVEDINKSFPVLDPKDKGEEGGVDPSVTEKEDVNASGFDLFKAAILERYRRLSESIISWIPKGQSAFWLNSNYSDDWWVIDKVDNSQTLTIAIDGTNKTITFTKCEIKKTGLKIILFEFAYSYYSALQTVKQIPDSQKLVIGLDSDLTPDQIKEIKRRLGMEQNTMDTLFPGKEMQIGGFYVKSLFSIEGAKDNEITSAIVDNSDLNVNITISKIKNMPDISFEDFSKSSVIKIINRK